MVTTKRRRDETATAKLNATPRVEAPQNILSGAWEQASEWERTSPFQVVCWQSTNHLTIKTRVYMNPRCPPPILPLIETQVLSTQRMSLTLWADSRANEKKDKLQKQLPRLTGVTASTLVSVSSCIPLFNSYITSGAGSIPSAGPSPFSEPFIWRINPLLRKDTEHQRLSAPFAHLTNPSRQFSTLSTLYLPYPLHLPLRFPNAQYLHPPLIRLIAIIIILSWS